MKKILVSSIIFLYLVSFVLAGPTIVDVSITDPNHNDQICTETTCVDGTATAIGGSGQLDVIFVMDTSGSMSWNDPLNYRLTGAKALIDMLPVGSQVAIAVEDFDSSATITQGFTSNHATAKAAIDALGASGGTNIGNAVHTANMYLQNNGRAGAAWVEILFTDGVSSPAYSSTYTTEAANLGITIHTMGLGSGVNTAVLQGIATGTGGTYTFVSDPANLPTVFPSLSLTNIAGVTVNGNAATVFPNGNFQYCGLPLVLGSNPIVAIATATDQTTGTDRITVTRIENCGPTGGEIPEFGSIGAIAALLGIGGLVYTKRRKK